MMIEENESIDMITNIYFSRKKLFEDNRKSLKPILAIITDEYHLERTIWLSEKILGNKAHSIVLSAPFGGFRPYLRFKEKVLLKATKMDMNDIINGCKQQLDNYLKKKHPLIAKTPEKNYYGMALKLL